MHMPEFQHQQDPEDLAIVTAVHRLVLRPKPLQQIRAKVPTLAASWTSEHIESELTQSLRIGQPNTVRKTETMFGFLDDFLRKEVTHCLLEKIPQLCALHFPTRRNSPRKLREFGIQERISRRYSS